MARGFTQFPDWTIRITETYALVARLASFRTILALRHAARQAWNIDTFDFDSAYLIGELGDDDETHMEEPPGYETPGEDSVVRLPKAIYGLTGRKCYDTLSRILTDFGFCVSGADPAVFVAHKGEPIFILAAHVGNCITTGSSPELIQDLKQKLNNCYVLTDTLGPLTDS